MDSRFINAFLESTRALLGTMLNTTVTFGAPHIYDRLTKHDVSGIVGFSGDVVGSVVLCLPKASALELVARLAGTPLAFESADFTDAVGELVNMIAGGAKARFTGRTVAISCPSVVVASEHQVQAPSGTVCVCIPCSSPTGEFAINVAIQASAPAPGVPGAARAGARA